MWLWLIFGLSFSLGPALVNSLGFALVNDVQPWV